jgi:hypothetical protein
VVALTEHAVPLRYDEILDTEPIDRQATLVLVNDVGDWASTQLFPVTGPELNRPPSGRMRLLRFTYGRKGKGSD